MSEFTAEAKAFFQAPHFAHLAVLREDGSPMVAPIWVDVDGDRIIFSTQNNSPKIKALQRDPRVALSVVKVDDPYSEALVRGRVVDIKADGAGPRMHAISNKYIQQDFPWPVDNQVTVYIEVESVATRSIPFKSPALARLQS